MKRVRVLLENAREKEQLKVMENILKKNVCPFCLKNIKDYHKKPIIKNGRYWILTENQWPYKNTRIHLLAISKMHAEQLSQLDPAAGKELLELAQWVEKKYKIKGGAIGFRFGNPKINKATVNHLHVHILTVKINNPKKRGYQQVKFKMG